MVEKAQLSLDYIEKARVRVANGELLPSEGRCKRVKVKIQGFMITVDVHVLVLASCEMVLDIQWLRELGTHETLRN